MFIVKSLNCNKWSFVDKLLPFCQILRFQFKKRDKFDSLMTYLPFDILLLSQKMHYFSKRSIFWCFKYYLVFLLYYYIPFYFYIISVWGIVSHDEVQRQKSCALWKVSVPISLPCGRVSQNSEHKFFLMNGKRIAKKKNKKKLMNIISIINFDFSFLWHWYNFFKKQYG